MSGQSVQTISGDTFLPDGYYISLVLIDKKLRQFMRSQTSSTSLGAERMFQGIFFSPFSFGRQMMATNMLFSPTRNHPILPPPKNTQATT